MPELDGTPRCERCGAELTADEDGLCTACAIEAAEGVAEANRAAAAAMATRQVPDVQVRAKRMRQLKIAVMVVCVAVIALRVPALVEAAQPLSPVRVGPVTTAGRCDDCVANLWKFSAALAEGSALPTTLECPATDAAYIVDVADGATDVNCPNPAKHALSGLAVSSAQLIPEAVAK